MNQGEPPTRRKGVDRRSAHLSSAGTGAEREAEAVLVTMEECLARLDRLGWTLAAAHLSQAIETVRERVLWSRIEQENGAEGVRL